MSGRRPARLSALGFAPRLRAAALTGLAALLAAGGCRIGDPTPSDAHVAWAAFPDTVLVGQPFSFEFAGPISPDACGRLDTAMVTVQNSVIELSAQRSTFQTLCPRERVAFYEARAMAIGRPGQYTVRTVDGLELGTLVAVEEGRFTPLRATGLGTLRTGGGCTLFGPGWAGNQRPFALEAVPPELLAEVGTDRLVWIEGRLVGFTLCGAFGSRPTLRLRDSRVTDRMGADWYPN